QLQAERHPVGQGEVGQGQERRRADAGLDLERLPGPQRFNGAVVVADGALDLEEGDGEPAAEGGLRRDTELAMAYRVRCPAAGRVRFEGVKVQFADLQGFFYHQAFVPAAAGYRVLPRLADARGHAPTTKRHNLLPPPGVHRLRRPGSGSELLDLRDYLPGDPPKTIAWKVSARRDRLITKEFESEVPVRCTLFVDTSGSVRVGPPGANALSRLTELAAAVAQANAAARDLTGLCPFDEKSASPVRPARGPRHLVELLNRLADVAGLAATTGEARQEPLLRLAHAFAEEVYPHLMRPEVNRVPGWLPWFWPVPAATGRRPGAFGVFLRLLVMGFLLLLCAALAAGLAFVAQALTLFGEDLGVFPPASPQSDDFLTALVLANWVGLGYLFCRLARLLWPALPLWFAPRQRRLARWRKRLAALLSLRQGLGPGGVGLLMEDDERFNLALQQFLGEHHVPYPLPLYDRQGRYLFAAPGKVEVLARALMQAVGKGHDNELFVLLADLLELSDRLDPLLRAVKVALARHHQVVVVCPWPAGLPPPGGAAEAPPPRGGRASAPASLRPLLRRATRLRFHRAYHELKRSFAAIGVPVVCAASEEPVPLILERMDRLRAVRRRR
ncbi:MAG TPA: DUF58 domain-containing protein, partial [Gemmataceae bacterium]|nr:DUF58 domain-containing protein [Gemmataceae bacterium]